MTFTDSLIRHGMPHRYDCRGSTAGRIIGTQTPRTIQVGVRAVF